MGATIPIQYRIILLLLCLAPGPVLAALDAPHKPAGSNGASSIGCLSCHQMTSTYPKLLPPLHHTPTEIDDTLSNNICWSCHNDPMPLECRACHTSTSAPFVETHTDPQGSWSVECWVCHNQHVQEQNRYNGSTYGKYIRRTLNLANITGPGTTGSKSVVFKGQTGANSFADSDTTYNGICEVCHTQTNHFQNDGSSVDQLHNVAPDGKPAKVGAGIACTICHKHEKGFVASMPSHDADPGSDLVMVFEEGTHDSVMEGDGVVEAACQMCHNTELSAAHDYQCLLCHPSPAETVVGSWGGGCQQGGCHATIHADVSAAHNTVDDVCDNCHGPGWWPTSAECVNCHALYNPADTTPPVTTSNVKATYLGPARIAYTVRDGGKVVVAQSYSRVDGGTAVMGSSIVVTEAGNRTLQFWSVDQANNIESPNEVNFEIVQDTTPPVTVSNAQPVHYGYANISLSASDDGDLVVKSTYYSLDGGPTQTGTSVFVSGSPGTFPHTLKFWSEDWSGNVEDFTEADNSVSFSIASGTGTFRMWGGGSSCANDPDADAYWIIKRNDYSGAILAEGSDGCDKSFPVGATGYFIMETWWVETTPGNGYWDEAYYGTFSLTTNGQVIELN